MTSLTDAQARAVRGIAAALLDTIEESGDMGAPGGLMYAALASKLSLTQFESITLPMVRRGYLRIENDCYFMTASGKAFRKALADSERRCTSTA